jgi:hypothetical protein
LNLTHLNCKLCRGDKGSNVISLIKRFNEGYGITQQMKMKACLLIKQLLKPVLPVVTGGMYMHILTFFLKFFLSNC